MKTARCAPTQNQQLSDLVECPICQEAFTDPRTLPCIHSFCLRCIETYTKSINGRRSQHTCPICRKRFNLPPSGVNGLPKNFFISKLCNVQEQLQPKFKFKKEVKKCKGCCCTLAVAVGNLNPTSAAVAGFCNECHQEQVRSVPLCADINKKVINKNCQRYDCTHANQSNNAIVSSDEPVVRVVKKPVAETPTRVKTTVCDEHYGEPLTTYCNDCGFAICSICSTHATHSTHKLYDIKHVAKKFIQQLKSDVEGLVKIAKEYDGMLDRLVDDRRMLEERVKKYHQAISGGVEELVTVVERNKSRLLDDVASISQIRVKQIDEVIEEVEMRLVSVDGLKRYMEELVNHGTAGDVAREIQVLHDRSDDLNQREVICQSLGSLGSISVRFTQSNIRTETADLIGEFDCQLRGCKKDVRRWNSTLVHVMPPQGVVGGVTSLGNDIFVVRIAVNKIEVYDANNFRLKRKLAIGNADNLFGVTSCAANHCLYVADHYGSKIIKVEPYQHDRTKRWSVANCPVGLSVNHVHNVLVACYGAHKIQEFTTQGSQVRVISLSPKILNPIDVSQLSSGQFVIAYGSWDSAYRVSVVDSDGNVICSYCDEANSSARQINGSSTLTVDRKDNIMLCEWSKNRVLVLNSLLNETRDFPLGEVEGELKEPWALSLNESQGRLYIGEWSGQRILAYNIVPTATK